MKIKATHTIAIFAILGALTSLVHWTAGAILIAISILLSIITFSRKPTDEKEEKDISDHLVD